MIYRRSSESPKIHVATRDREQRGRAARAPCPVLDRRGSMTGALARSGSVVVVLGLLCTPSTFGQVGLNFNGSSASPLILQPGDVALFQVSGPPNAPFAALISPQPLFEVTAYGILLANPL